MRQNIDLEGFALDEAENRLHVQKALMLNLLGKS